MKTSINYRNYRSFFNSNANNHSLFGNRVHNPINSSSSRGLKANHVAALIRGAIVVVLGWAMVAAIL